MPTTGMTRGQIVTAVLAVALVAAACGDADNAVEASSTTTPPTTTSIATTTTSTSTTAPTTTVTTTAEPVGVPLLEPGDEGPAVRTLQYLLDCAEWGDVVVDGVYGPQTEAAIEALQTFAQRDATGVADAFVIANAGSGALETCIRQPIRFPAGATGTTVGYFARDELEPLSYALALEEGQTLTLSIRGDIDVRMFGPDGSELTPDGDAVSISVTGEHSIQAFSAFDDLVAYEIGIEAPPLEGSAAPAVTIELHPYGVFQPSSPDGASASSLLEFGDDPDLVIATMNTLLGVEGPEFDFGWVATDGFPEGVLCRDGTTEARLVGYGDLTLVFWDAPTDFDPAGGRHWAAYRVSYVSPDFGTNTPGLGIPADPTQSTPSVIIGSTTDEIAGSWPIDEATGVISFFTGEGDERLTGSLSDDPRSGPIGSVSAFRGGIWCDGYDGPGFEAFKP